jgi:phosphatidylserine decarboxylase
MEHTNDTRRAVIEPLPSNIPSIQPGGGVCYEIELAWGNVRRWYLKTFRRAYVERMARLRHGDPTGCPHEVLDPRDLKFFRNQCTASWPADADPFQWRERLPFARWGLAELQLMGYPLLLATIISAATFGRTYVPFWPIALVTGVILFLIVWFFRDPTRVVPTEPGLVVSPADGKVVEITRLEYDGYLDGPAVRIGIFLSIFNVHINRAPLAGRVTSLKYFPGLFLNALNPESATANEAMWIGFEEERAPFRRFAVRQIAGLFARRIVCDVRPGESLARGHKFGMIKLGSRTELILPATEDLVIVAEIGQKVCAGADVLARFRS